MILLGESVCLASECHRFSDLEMASLVTLPPASCPGLGPGYTLVLLPAALPKAGLMANLEGGRTPWSHPKGKWLCPTEPHGAHYCMVPGQCTWDVPACAEHCCENTMTGLFPQENFDLGAPGRRLKGPPPCKVTRLG